MIAKDGTTKDWGKGEPTPGTPKAVLISAVPPLMLKTEKNPGGLPMDAFHQLRTALVNDRAQFFTGLPFPDRARRG